jgi:hypothetical protein
MDKNEIKDWEKGSLGYVMVTNPEGLRPGLEDLIYRYCGFWVSHFVSDCFGVISGMI